VPPLRNPDVTGLTKGKQDEVIRESGTAPDRGKAAEEFLDEQQEQARTTDPANDRQAGRVPSTGGTHPGLTAEDQTELEKHWDPKASRRR
jgi:hypothetical protein